MYSYREQLEGTPRLLRIRRIRRLVLGLLAALVLALSAYAMVIAGAGLKPLFLPIDAFLAVALLLVFIAALANFAFRELEVRHARRDSQRYLIAKDGMRRARTLAIVGVVAGALLLVPFTASSASALLSETMVGTVEAGDTAAWTFPNQDAFAVTQFSEIQVVIRNARLATIVVANERGAQTLFVTPQQPSRFPVDTSGLLHYTLSIENLDSRPLTYEVQFLKILMPELTSVVPIILLAFAGSNVVWFAYLRPLARRFAASSIYSVRYVEEVATGERTFAEYYPARHGPPRPR